MRKVILIIYSLARCSIGIRGVGNSACTIDPHISIKLHLNSMWGVSVNVQGIIISSHHASFLSLFGYLRSMDSTYRMLVRSCWPRPVSETASPPTRWAMRGCVVCYSRVTTLKVELRVRGHRACLRCITVFGVAVGNKMCLSLAPQPCMHGDEGGEVARWPSVSAWSVALLFIMHLPNMRPHNDQLFCQHFEKNLQPNF